MAINFPDHPPYIPIIKWQSYEQKALKKVVPDVGRHVLPCVEVRDSAQHINLMGAFHGTWGSSAMVDYADPKGVLTANRKREFHDFLASANGLGLPIVPVFNPYDVPGLGAPLQNLAASFGEAALRLRVPALSITADHLANVTTAYNALAAHGLRMSLIIDLGVAPQTWTNADTQRFSTELSQFQPLGFTSIHVASGAYPESLAAVKTGVGVFNRRDWSFWRDLNAAAPGMKIGFSDYGVLSPVWTEEALTRRGARVAIRYTRNNDWLILRADGKKKTDSVAISEIMVNAYAADFKGPTYSFGDELLAERADPTVLLTKKRCGHYHITEGWSHHIAVVVKEQY